MLVEVIECPICKTELSVSEEYFNCSKAVCAQCGNTFGMPRLQSLQNRLENRRRLKEKNMTRNMSCSPFAAYLNYFDFSGRASRAEYWMFMLWDGFWCSMWYTALMIAASFEIEWLAYGFGVLFIITRIINFIPRLSVTARRFHDVGRSFWLYFIPLAGPLLAFGYSFVDSKPGSNKYGPCPK